MDNRLDIQQITKRLENAFKPYKCIVEAPDYENLIYAKILDKNGALIIKTPSVSIADINNESSLSTFIDRTKVTMESKGYFV